MTIDNPQEMKTEGTQLSVFSNDGFELLQRMAKMFSASTLVPKHYQGASGLANCMIALNMAQRIGSDPLMTMQNLYVVHGTPAWSAQFLIATFNTCGRYGPIQYEFSGTRGKDDWGCRARAEDKATGKQIEGTLITIALAKAEGWHDKSGSKWKTMPEQMLRYRSAAWLIRAHAPELAMGLHTADEAEEMGNQNYEKIVGKKVTMLPLDSGVVVEEITEDGEQAGEPGRLFAVGDGVGQ